eukprot:3308208-Amphidinium_carterae.1
MIIVRIVEVEVHHDMSEHSSSSHVISWAVVSARPSEALFWWVESLCGLERMKRTLEMKFGAQEQHHACTFLE